ncbi:hypothetical protein GCM10027047_17900 [Rhodococcus aerolatus]
MRYNPPPTWPQPPAGWSPPPGWQPDPAWGPPPPGWALWVPEEGSSGGARRSGAVWAAVGVVVLLLVAGGVVGAVLLTRGSDGSSTVAAPGGAAPTTGAEAAGSSGGAAGGSATTPATASAPGPSGCAAVPATSSDPAPLGQGAVVGSFCVAVTRVVQDATAAVTAASSLNPPPKNGRYLVLTLDALNQSGSSEDPYFALYVNLRTQGGTTYEDTDCTAVLDDDLVSSGDTAPGARATGSVCLDVPSGDLPGAELTISGARGENTRVFATR